MNDRIQTTIPCCITGSRDALVVATKDRHGGPLRTVLSTDSGLVFTDPRPEPAEIKQFYAEDYRVQYKQTVVPKDKHILRAGRNAIRRFDRIRRHLPETAETLDVGSGGGEFVYTCQRHGCRAHGIEPNRGYAQFSIQQYGIDVFNGSHEDAEFQDGTFDAVTLFHVLEHLEDPVWSLSRLGRFLKPGGQLFVEVPNVDYTETAPNQKWHIGHLYNFSLQTLVATGAKAGLEPVEACPIDNDGNLFLVLRKQETPYEPDLGDILGGAFENTYRILSGHTMVGHYARFHVPLGRLIGRIRRTANEKATVRRYASDSPVAILDGLLAGDIR
jgi:2-polyprenyl-3-methyl-5-hydroxy-6-metoxy-1,4-benzoquinol methylase